MSPRVAPEAREPGSSGPSGLVASGVEVTLGRRTVLEGVDIRVRAGEILALVGPNGAGKSTLLGVLSGDLVPSRGSVTLDGRPLSRIHGRELARRRALLAQQNLVSFPFLVAEVIAMGRTPWVRTDRFDDDERMIARAIDLADVSHLLDRRFTELSGGERARVSLARVLAQDTDIYLLDEPTAALDLRHQEEVMALARDLARQGRAVAVVVHDLSLAGAYADRVGLVVGGRLVADGPPGEVLTSDTVSDAYGLQVRIVDDLGRPLVVPIR